MMTKTFKIGFSPCPNDTFIFDALVNGKIDTEGFSFEPVLEDVETLNQWAYEGRLPITKLSYYTLLNVLDKYNILDAGSALGKGCGPLLVAKEEISPSMVEKCRIAIPGAHTTANMLLSFAFPNALQKTSLPFSSIEDEVISGNYDLGLIIHESRFTYRSKGLNKVMDLGEYWEKETGCPIPLGGIAVDKNMPLDVQQQITQLIRKSLEYAYTLYPELSTFVVEHAQSMEEAVMRNHIDLYVNNYSKNLGTEGKNAIKRMMSLLPEPKLSLDEADHVFVG